MNLSILPFIEETILGKVNQVVIMRQAKLIQFLVLHRPQVSAQAETGQFLKVSENNYLSITDSLHIKTFKHT